MTQALLLQVMLDVVLDEQELQGATPPPKKGEQKMSKKQKQNTKPRGDNPPRNDILFVIRRLLLVS